MPSYSEAEGQRGMESAKLFWSALTSTLAAELAATPVIVNAVCPGLTATYPGAEGMGTRPVAQAQLGSCGRPRCPAPAARWVLPRWIACGPQRPANALKHRHGASIRWPHHESIA